MYLGRERDLKPPIALDLPIVIVTLLLVSISLVMIYSTTGVLSQERFGDPFYYLKRQAIAAVVGVCILLLCTRLTLPQLRVLSPWCGLLAVALLGLTLIPGLGQSAGGASRWIGIMGVRFQPGEFVKVLVVLFMAGYLARQEDRLRSFTHGLLKPLLIVALPAGLFLLQPDFGSAAVITLLVVGMTAVAGARIQHLAACGVALVAAASALVVLSPYRMARVLAFLSPWEDASGQGYQLIQSLIAIGLGRWDGVGLGDSQQKLFFLPAAHTDFIFSVVAEELGFIGAVALILLFLVLLWRGLVVASRFGDDTFSFTLAVGLTFVIVLPAFLNVGVATGLLPTKGMVLPFVGYGGSNMVASLAAVGLLLALTREFRRG